MEKLAKLLAAEDKPDAEFVFTALAEDIIADLGADLITIWKLDNELSEIRCVFCYDPTGQVDVKGRRVTKDKAPSYFDYIIEHIFINTNDIPNHPATREVYKTYSKKYEVKAMLDFVLHRDFKPVGILCSESRKNGKKWGKAEEDCVRRLVLMAGAYF